MGETIQDRRLARLAGGVPPLGLRLGLDIWWPMGAELPRAEAAALTGEPQLWKLGLACACEARREQKQRVLALGRGVGDCLKVVAEMVLGCDSRSSFEA